MSWKILPVLFLAVLAPAKAHAQYQMISPMLYNGPQISLQDHAARTRQPRSANKSPSADGYRATSGRGDGEITGTAALSYRPDLRRRRANLAMFVAKARTSDPAGADSLAQMFASGDIIEKIGDLVRPAGLRIDNVADAYALYWIHAWQATRGNNDTPSRAKVTAVKDQAARALAGTPAFGGASDATKQELAESLWIQAALLDTNIELAKGRPDLLRAVGAAAGQGARAMGIDLSRMSLTEQGFIESP